MKRRNVISQAIGITGAVAVGCSTDPSPEVNKPPKESPSEKGSVTNWRMITSWPRTLDVFESLEKLCERVADMTNGRFVITPYEGGEMVEPLGNLFDAVKKGKSELGESVHCGHTALYYFTDIHPALAFGTSVPFGFNTQQQHAWLYQGGGRVALQEILKEHGLQWFPAGNTTGQMGGWFSKPIKNRDDLRGLKMRIPGLGQQVLTRLGVEAVTLPAQDIVQAWHDRRIDAVEWIGPSEDKDLGLHKVARYYYYPGWWEPGTSFAILVNQEAWQELDPANKAVFEAATMEANLEMMAGYNAKNGKTLQDFLSRGINVQSFSKRFLEDCRREVFEFYEEQAENDPVFNNIYQDWKIFRKSLFKWYGVSSFSFSQFAYKKERKSSKTNRQYETTEMCLPKENSIG